MNSVILLIACAAFLLITIVLVQNPKGGGIDSTFGGAKADRTLGVARSTNLTEKLTWTLAATVFIACIAMAAFI